MRDSFLKPRVDEKTMQEECKRPQRWGQDRAEEMCKSNGDGAAHYRKRKYELKVREAELKS